jgi:perosamine synthetase
MNKSQTFVPVAQPDIGALEERYLLDAFRSGWISSIGEYVTRFEASFAQFCNARFGVAVSNGTTAIQLALLACDVGPGDEVIVPPLTFAATAAAVRHVGATPVFADCEEDIGTLDPRAVRRAITPKTKAIIPVHLYGHPADMDPILELADAANIAVIEDAAEAHGARYRDRVIGGIGTISTFSFYGNKIITTGEGGMVVTNSEALASRVRLLKDHAMDPGRRYWHQEVGFNFRMTNLQAAIGCAQLERASELISRRQEVLSTYKSAFLGGQVKINPARDWARPVPWLVCAVLPSGEQRDEVMAALKREGIDTRPYFHMLCDMPPYANCRTHAVSQGNCPVARDLSLRGLNLPMSTTIPSDRISDIARRSMEAIAANLASTT